MAEDIPEFDPSKPSTPAPPEFDPSKPSTPVHAERGVLERAGQAAAETFTGGWEALKRPFQPVSKEEIEAANVAQPTWSGTLEAAKRGAATLLSPLTMTAGAGFAPIESLAESGAGELARAVGRGLSRSKLLSPEMRERIKTQIPTSEEAYEAMRHPPPAELAPGIPSPGVGEAFSALAPARGGRWGWAAGRAGGPEKILPVVPTEKVPAAGPEAMAGRALEAAAEDPEAVRRALEAGTTEYVPGSQPTTFQATGDPGLGQAERGAQVRQAAAFDQLRTAQNTARIKALGEVQRNGSPQDVADYLRDTMRAEDAAAEQVTKLANQRAWEASQLPGGTYDPATYGNVFRRELENAETAARTHERMLWDLVDPHKDLRANPQPMQELERSVYGTMMEGGAAEASLTPAERQISEIIKNYPPVIPFQELRDLRSLVSTKLREELWEKGETQAYGRLSRLRGGIEDAVTRSVFDDVGEHKGNIIAERLRAASAATSERATTFRAPGVKEVRRRQGVGGPYKVGEAMVPEQFIKTGPAGYDRASNFLRATGNDNGLPIFQDAVAAKMRRVAFNPDGMINPTKLQTFLRQHQEVLRAIDERDGGAFSQVLRDAGEAQKAAEGAVERQQMLAERHGKTELGKLLGLTDNRDIENVVGNLFDRQDSVMRARNLAAGLRASPAAQDGLRRAIVNYITNRFVGVMEAGNSGENVLRAGKFQEFVRANRPALEQLMSPQQVETLAAIAKDMQRTSRTLGTKIPGGSNTVQDQFIQQRGVPSKALGAVGRLVFHHIMRKVPVVGRPLAGGLEAGWTWLAAKGQEQALAEVQRLFDRALLEPGYTKEILGKGYREKTFYRRGVGPTAYEAAAQSQNRQDRSVALRQGGGAVPGYGGKSARSAHRAAAASARKGISPSGCVAQTSRKVARHQDGGEIKPGTHGHLAALMQGSPSGGGIMGKFAPSKVTPPKPLTRYDIAQQLAGAGVPYSDFVEKAPAFQEGGDTDVDSRYETKLNPDEERSFQDWKQQNAPHDSGADYDLRGAYKAGVMPDPNTGHWPDTFKKPNHPTFSDQSMYAKDRPELAGHWEGDTYIPPDRAGGFEAAAARVRRRYPTREPDPRALAASQGKVTWSQFLPSQERALAAAGALQRGEDYDPRDVFLSTLGAVGAPSAGLTGEAATLGAGAVRRAVPRLAPETAGPAAGLRPLTAAERAAPRPEAPFPQYAEEYPPVGPPRMVEQTDPKKIARGELEYPEKQLTPEAEEVQKARSKIMADMKKRGYSPYFDPAERFPVDPSKYPGPKIETLDIAPTRADTIKKYMDQIGAPETANLLEQAYRRGQELGNAHDWYFMGQLEAAYIKELGAKAGRKTFLDEWAVPMAATTSGQSPTPNLLTAHYFEYLRKRGEPIPEGHQFPFPIGGRRPAMNIRDYETMRERGGYEGFDVGQPKMHNYIRSFLGDLSRAVMDEQMAGGMLAHAGKESLADPARRIAYGMLERPVHTLAQRLGLEPGAVQDVAWAGFKNEPGWPMISHVNDAIERTHRLTGMPRDEIVRRAIIRKEIPLYTTGPMPVPGLQQEQQ